MNGAQLHLMLNHLPVMGTLFSLLLLAWSLIRRSAEIQKLALGVALLAGLSSVPAYLTGEPAEEVIEHMAGVDEAYIEEHESMGKFALWCGVALGVVAAARWRQESETRAGCPQVQRLPSWQARWCSA
jgi:hypothetical protein